MITAPNFARWLCLWTRLHGGAHSGDLKNADQMRAVLQRERMRADRGGAGFALLVFRFADRRRQQAHLGRLASLFAERLRATDEAGHLDSDRIAALLPETGEAGARTLAEKIREAMAIEGVRLDHAIHVYPVRGGGWGDEALNAVLPGAAIEDAAVLPADGLFVRPLPWWKRALDLIGASAGLIVAAPILLVAAAAIKVTSPGPVFFRQKRAGLGGKTFFIYKLRTMHADAERLKASLRPQSEQDGPAFKMRDDPRVTRVGKYLRITCIDELPQLWNVLRGDMSLVGPRPLPCDESEQCLDWQRRRLDVTPGLTCIWQVFGGMRVPFQDWMRMDLRYIASRKPSVDLALLLRTLWAVIRHRASR